MADLTYLEYVVFSKRNYQKCLTLIFWSAYYLLEKVWKWEHQESCAFSAEFQWEGCWRVTASLVLSLGLKLSPPVCM